MHSEKKLNEDFHMT